MDKLNKKIDIKQVIIAPVFALKSKEITYEGDIIHRHAVHGYNNEFAAVIPIYNEEFGAYYNLSNNFEEIDKVFSDKHYVQLNKRLVNIEEGKKLIDYLTSSKFSFNENRYISYKNLLYIIEPITKFEEYRHNSNRKKFKYDEKKCISVDVNFKNKLFNNCMLEKGKHYALYTQNGLPVSYEYISDEIPYVLKK